MGKFYKSLLVLVAAGLTSACAWAQTAEEYPLNFNKDTDVNPGDPAWVGRTLRSVTLTENGKEGQTINVANPSKIYNDQHETAKLTCTAGSTLTAEFDYTGAPGAWMHGYVFIDTDNNKQFSFRGGDMDQTGTEVYAYAFYSGDFNNDNSGKNNAGQTVTDANRAQINPPSFTAPTTPGTYRIRFKVDWNSVDPGGQRAEDGTIFGHNGIGYTGGCILDATLVVEGDAPIAPLAPISITPADQSQLESFTEARITFADAVTYNPEKEITIGQRNGTYYEAANVSVDGSTVTISVAETITASGFYAINVPEGAFSNQEGRTNEAFTTTFSIVAPANSFVYTKAEPENGTTVESLSVIKLTYPEYVTQQPVTEQIPVVNEKGETVTTATLSADFDAWDVINITLAKEITANGTYSLTIPEAYLGNDYFDSSQEDKNASGGALYNPEFTLTYTVENAPLEPLAPTSITPAAGETVSSFTAATLTFDTEIGYDSEKIVEINDRNRNTYTASVTVEGNTATISVEEPITQTGYYTITIPAGAFTAENGRTNEAIATSFMLLAPANTFEYESANPANGSKVASLSTITLTFPENVNGSIINETPIEVKDAEGNTVTTAALSTDDSDYKAVHITLANEITTDGTYTLTIPEEYIGNEGYISTDPDKGAAFGGTYNPEFTLTYTVDITLGINNITISNAAGKTVYSIDGRQVNGKLQRGTYIINGQKRFVK